MGSVLWVREIPGGKRGGQDERGRSSYHNEWHVLCNSPTMTRAEVLGCGSLPVYGSPNAEDTKAVCIKTDAHRVEGHPCLWVATADWQSSPVSGQDPTDMQKQPDQRRARWSSRYTPIPVSRFVDYGGSDTWLSGLTPSGHSRGPWLLTDQAGTPFDPPPDIPIYAEEVSVQQYEATAARTTKRAYMGCTNTDTWCGATQGTALVDDITTVDEFIQGAWWWLTIYKILIKPRITIALPNGGTTYVGGWYPDFVLNAGPLCLVYDSSGNFIRKQQPAGRPYDGRPTMLDIKGQEIPLNADGSLSADPIFLRFFSKQTATFAGLNLTPPDGWNT